MPANGNAGWMDEAIARWRDNRYPLVERLTFSASSMAGRSPWIRQTDRMAYTQGSEFLAWIAQRMSARGGDFKLFLREYFERHKYTTVTTPLFQKELTEASGLDLTPDFDRFIFGRQKSHAGHTHETEDPMHPRYTDEQLSELTMPTQF
jgi:hypothetical protein